MCRVGAFRRDPKPARDGCVDDGTVCGNSKVEGDEQCDDGNTVGGDGCAENCTEEVSVSCVISEGSEAALQWADARISFPLSGTLPYAVGRPRDSAGNGEIPFVIGATELDPIPIVGVGCACVTYEPSDDFGGNAGTGVAGCGVGLDDTDYVVSLDHYTNDVDPECEEGARVEDGFARFPHEGVCNGPAFSTLSGSLAGVFPVLDFPIGGDSVVVLVQRYE